MRKRLLRIWNDFIRSTVVTIFGWNQPAWQWDSNLFTVASVLGRRWTKKTISQIILSCPVKNLKYAERFWTQNFVEEKTQSYSKGIFFWHSITPNHKQPHLTDNFCRNVWTLTTFWWLFTARKWKSFWLLWINWILFILRNQMNSVGNMIHVTELSW